MRSQDMADLFSSLLAKPTTALCHSSASGPGYLHCLLELRAIFSHSSPRGFVTTGPALGVWAAWVGWSSHNREMEILVLGTTEKLWELQIP